MPRAFSGELLFQKREYADTLEALFDGTGYRFPLQENAWSSPPIIGPEPGAAYAIERTSPVPLFGQACIEVTGSLAYEIGLRDEKWTVMVYRWDGAAWVHYAIRSSVDGIFKWVDGVRNDGASTPWLLYAGGVVQLEAGFYQDLVAFSAVLTPSLIEHVGTNAVEFSDLPRLVVDGDCVGNQPGVYTPTLDGQGWTKLAEQSLRSLSVRLRELRPPGRVTIPRPFCGWRLEDGRLSGGEIQAAWGAFVGTVAGPADEDAEGIFGIGTAWEFDGSSNHQIDLEVEFGDAFAGATQATVLAAIGREDVAQDRTIIEIANSVGSMLRLWVTAAGNLSFEVEPNTADGGEVLTGAIDVDRDSVVAGVVDLPTGTLWLYQDGIQIATSTGGFGGTGADPFAADTVAARIGRRTGGTNRWSGRLGAVHLYRRALRPEWIRWYERSARRGGLS
jgi:hypothetical protein